MAMKSVILITLLAVFLATQAEAQVTGPILNVVNVIGNVSCSVNGNVVVNSTIPTPPFRNALVQLSCNGTVRGLSITDSNGSFGITVSQISLNNTITGILRDCRAVVGTPLSTCNATLPSTGVLQAPLRNVGNIAVGLLNITILAVGSFSQTL